MAFPVLNAAKPLSSVKSCGSELHRLIIHCVKIVSPFISLKCIAFRSVCPLCSYIIGHLMPVENKHATDIITMAMG